MQRTGTTLARLAVLAAATLTIAAAVHGATERRVPSPLDARVRLLDGGSVSVLPSALEQLAISDPFRTRWEEFSRHGGGDWRVWLDERTALPTLVSGPGLPWFDAGDDPTLDDLDRRARAFLAENAPLVGTGAATVELDRAASLRLAPEHWQLVYRQSFDGVRVENARLHLHVVAGRLAMLGFDLWARTGASGIPAVEAEWARRLLDAYLGDDAAGLAPAGEPELTLVAVEGERSELAHRLLWRIALDEIGTPRRWIGEVDAHDGTIAAFYESSAYAAIRGGVFPITNDGDCLTGGCEAERLPLPFADFTETGAPESFGDDFGNLTCTDSDAGFTTTLDGPYVRIADTCGAASEPGTCADGADLGMKHGENCASAAPGASAGNTSAARTAYYHVNRVAEIARFYDSTNTWIRNPLTVNVNVSSSCNAIWTGSVINMYGAGGNCRNTGENASILVHEWGHGYDQNDGGGLDKPSEAYADITAMLTTHDSCMSRGIYSNGQTCTGEGDTCLTCTGFRDFDWSARASNTPATPQDFANVRCPVDNSIFSGPCQREPHCESYVSSEAIYDLATRDLPAMGMDPASAWQLVERLWYGTRPGSGGNAYTCVSSLSNSCGATSWYQRMRVADDDDGNLANGTPHAAALFAAFKRHNIACGAVSDATNRNQSSCPALAMPTVTRSMTPAGVRLDWTPVANAASYRVSRSEIGCARQPVPRGVGPAAPTTYTDNSADAPAVRSYRVQAFGTNSKCAGPVSGCVGAPPGSRLAVTDHGIVDDGDGVPEPGETWSLPVTLLNSGVDPATSVTGSLVLTGPSIARVLTPVADWPVIDPSTVQETDAPHFEIVMLEQASCLGTVAFELTGAAANSAPFARTIAFAMGTQSRDYPETSIVPIPSLTATPVQVGFVVPDDKTVADIDVTLDIFHQTPTQLVVELTSPQGTTVRLHNRSAGSGHGIETRYDLTTAPDGPGTMADFVGEPAMGTWTLSVSDVDGTGITTDGYIRPRTLHLHAVEVFGCDPHVCAEPTPSVAPALTVDLAPNGTDLVLSWTAVAGADGYHVLRSADPTFATGVELLGAPTTQTALTVPSGATTPPALQFLQVRAVNGCHQEGP
jgi:hypothetical protein